VRTDGDILRVSRKDTASYWEGRGTEATEQLIGLRLSPAQWVDLIRGRRDAPEGWSVAVHPDSSACLPRRVSLTGRDGRGREVRLELDWDSVELWNDPIRSLGPPPAGYEKVERLPLGEMDGERR